MRTALVETVDTLDVDRAHLGCPANGHVGNGDGNDGWLAVP